MKDVILNPKMPKVREEGFCAWCYERPCTCFTFDRAYGEGGYHPWMDDGFRILGKGWTKGIEDVWKVQAWKKIRLVRMVCNYYLLDGIASCVIVPGAAPPQTIMNAELMIDMLDAGFYVREKGTDLEANTFEAAVAFAKLVTKYAPIVRDYMHFAMAGELSCTQDLSRSIGDYEDWDEACVSWWYLIQEFGYKLAAKWAMLAFDKCHWSTGYGGPAWEGIAKVAYAYETGEWKDQSFGSREFLDRAFSLQHNNATVFDKTQWADCPEDLEFVLDAHASSYWGTLYDNASPTTKTLFNKHVKACGQNPKDLQKTYDY